MKTAFCILTALLMVPAAAQAQQGTLSAADYADIEQVYARYNQGVDSGNAQMMATVFTPDGEFVNGTRTTKGRELAQGPAKERPQARHMATSIVITPSQEGARGSSYVMLVNLQATPPVVMGGGVYEDVLVKTAEGWRFKRRTYFSQSAPAAPPAAATAPR